MRERSKGLDFLGKTLLIPYFMHKVRICSEKGAKRINAQHGCFGSRSVLKVTFSASHAESRSHGYLVGQAVGTDTRYSINGADFEKERDSLREADKLQLGLATLNMIIGIQTVSLPGKI